MATGDPSSSLRVHMLEGPAVGAILQHEGKRLTLGRTRGAKLQVKDPSVSEKHAELVWTEGQWHLQDVGSSNGTVLNGAPLQPDASPVALTDGDTIRFGAESVARVEITVHPDDTLTVQQFLEAECQQLGQRLRSQAERLGNELRSMWMEQKQMLSA